MFDWSALTYVGHIEQADGTGWMGMYSLNPLVNALELARDDTVYEDVASKFCEHFLYTAAAINNPQQRHWHVKRGGWLLVRLPAYAE